MMQKIKPILIPAIIIALISGLIIVVYNLTYVDTSTVVTDKQLAAVTQIYGEGDYSVIPVSEYPEALKNGDECNIPELTKIIRKSDGSIAFDMVVKGYKNGFDIMVGVKDGAVAGVAIVSVGEETPGLGTNTNKPEWLANFNGKTGEVVIVKNKTNPAENEVNAVTSATFSSKGVAKAVNLALKAYNACGGDFK
ncbi:MAG: FMN-binding protein [Oscillospiraceae bacterium]|nr:FMN-binding protein [Oscillospiraceae bacterium]